MLRLQIRYLKENGFYNVGKSSFYDSDLSKSGDEKELIKRLYCGSPYFFLYYLFNNIERENVCEFGRELVYGNCGLYFSHYYKYIFNIFRSEFINIFESFLRACGCYEEFFNNVNKDFIRTTILNCGGDIVGFEGCESTDKYNLVYNWLCPYGFLMNAFNWSKSPQGDNYWRHIHSKWSHSFIDFVNKL